MSNLKLFDVQDSNDERQNDLNLKLFGIRPSNVKCQTVCLVGVISPHGVEY